MKYLKVYLGLFLLSLLFFGFLCRSVAVIKSNKDTRYGLDSIVTHDGVKLPCSALANLSSFKQIFGSDAYDKVILCKNKMISVMKKDAVF